MLTLNKVNIAVIEQQVGIIGIYNIIICIPDKFLHGKKSNKTHVDKTMGIATRPRFARVYAVGAAAVPPGVVAPDVFIDRDIAPDVHNNVFVRALASERF